MNEEHAPIKLLWVFSTFALGGPQRRMATLTASLGAGYDHRVFAMDGCYDAEEVLPERVAYRRVTADVKKGSFLSLANIRAFRRVLAEQSPSVLLTSNWGAIEWLFANRVWGTVPHIHFEDGFGPDERPDAQNPKRVMARRLAFKKKALGFVAPSNVLKDVYSTTWRVDPARVHLIPNGVASARFEGKQRPERPVTIGTVAALRPEKRLDRLIAAFAGMSDTSSRLLIVGEGPERAALQAQAASLGDRVVFAGAQNDVAPFLADMDVYALSSDTEQMPISLVEGMASGLPVVSTDVGDVVSMVADENRPLIIPLGNEAGLVTALDTLAANPTLRAGLGRLNALKAMSQYDLATMTNRYDELFRTFAATRLKTQKSLAPSSVLGFR